MELCSRFVEARRDHPQGKLMDMVNQNIISRVHEAQRDYYC